MPIQLEEESGGKILVVMTGLQGWDAGAARQDIKFDVKHFSDIERLAMVGENRLQHRMAEFFKPFTKALTRYFDSADMAVAREWLDEAGPAIESGKRD